MEESKSNIDRMIEILVQEQYKSIHRTYWSGPGGFINLTDRKGTVYHFTDHVDIRTFVSTLKEILYINNYSHESNLH